MIFEADIARARFRREFNDSLVSLDPEIAPIELPLSEKVARRVAMLQPYAKEKNFNPYKVALVELGLENDDFYRNEFLGNLESTEATTAKTERLKIEEIGAKELSELEQLINRNVLQIINFKFSLIYEKIRISKLSKDLTTTRSILLILFRCLISMLT